MKLVTDAGVCDYVSRQGGVLWLRTTRQHCCFGALVSVRAGTSRPKDAASYRSLESDLPVDVRFLGTDQPGELTVVLRGLRHKHLVALWDGCKFKI